MIFEARRLTHEDAERVRETPDLVEEILEEEVDAGLAILGGDPIGEDMGYGPARLLAVDGVRDVAHALAEVDANTFRARIDLGAMSTADLYPQIADEPDLVDAYLVPSYVALRDFYSRAADRGEWVLQSIM